MNGYVERNPAGDEERNAAQDPAAAAENLDRSASERLEEIHQYLRDQYARRDVVAQTRTPSGQEFDWVPVESQGHPGKAADPPSEDRPGIPDGGEYRAEQARSDLEAPGVEVGPPGTVPLLRLPIEKITPTGRLQDWLGKGPRPTPVAPTDYPAGASSAAPEHKYALAIQYVSNYGTEGTLNLWKSYVEWSNEFSLGQLWLSRGPQAGNLVQTVEVGQQVYKDLYGDWLPHLFVFYTTNNYTLLGDNLGGYNQNVAGWKQVAANVAPGVGYSTTSQYGGQQYENAIKVQLDAGNWWVSVNGVWMGYYPASLFSASGLLNGSDRTDWGGEIVDAVSVPGTTATQMGSGRWPVEGFSWSAYARNLSYQSDPAGGMSRYQGFTNMSHPGCYGIAEDFVSAGSWQSFFYYGGLGKSPLNPGCP
jgi:hypothetical protein